MERATNQRGRSTSDASTGGIRPSPAVTFIGVVLMFSWGCWVPLLSETVSATSTLGVSLIVFGGFGPAFAAVLTITVHGGSHRQWFHSVFRWRVSLRWYAAALCIPPGLFVIAGLGHSLISGVGLRLSENVSLVQYPLSLLGIALIGGGQEELGWRGYLLPTIRTHLGPVTASITVGVIWAVWHAPLLLIAGTDQSTLPLGFYMAVILAASVLLTWIFEGSNGSVALAILFHAGMNAYAYYPAGGLVAARSRLGYGLITVAFVIAALVVTVSMVRDDPSKAVVSVTKA